MKPHTNAAQNLCQIIQENISGLMSGKGIMFILKLVFISR